MFHLYTVAALAAYVGASTSSQTTGLPPGSSYGVPGTNATYDYVVVGGGTAGLTAATRLAQDGRFSVAVVEAGGFYEQENGNHSVVPGLDALPAPGIDWNFVTIRQNQLDGRTLSYFRGKCLGGSSARNALLYQRPTVGTMQKWADEVGDQSWTWDNVLQFYKKSSTFTPPAQGSRPANATPGYDLSVFDKGPIQVAYAKYASPMGSWLLKAAGQLNVSSRTNGFESGKLLGASWLPNTLDPDSQERSTSETGYLPLGLQTERLTVYIHTFAQKIIFDRNTATGIDVESNGGSYRLTAAREVVLAAGAFQTPQLLMISGIGPRETLAHQGIPVVVDRAGVGQNLIDTVFYAPSYPLDVQTGSAFTNDPKLFSEAVSQYNQNRSGFLTSAGDDTFSEEKFTDIKSLNISASARQALSAYPSDWPQLQLWTFPTWAGPFFGSSPPNHQQNFGSITVSLMAPLSRGNVTINSSSMADPPVINPNWLSDPIDQELAVAAFRRARQYFETSAFKSIETGPEAYPGSNATTSAELLAVIRKQANPFYHAAATCKMGKSDDKMAVVDSKGRVIGAEKLRVVDASAFAFLPPGQPLGTVYMVAEKIASDILAG